MVYLTSATTVGVDLPCMVGSGLGQARGVGG